MIEKIVVTDAFFKHDGHILLHPALVSYEKSLLCMRQSSQASANHTPTSWLASKMGVEPASLLMSCMQLNLKKYQQYWVVSPYHARLTRSSLRVMPDTMLDFTAQQAKEICDILNPFLADDGVYLQTIGAALVLCSERVWDVFPVSFADISGQTLPDRLPQGKDAGSWMRLMSELQMMLHQNAVLTHGGLDIHGLWFWGQVEHPQWIDFTEIPCISTRNVMLQSVLRHHDKEQAATMMVTEAEHLPQLLQASSPLPKHWVLLGAGQLITLQNSVITATMAKLRAPTWKGI